MSITPVTVQGVSAAIEILKEARARNVRGSYHPKGGMTNRGYTPVKHTVWLACEFQQALEIKYAAKKRPISQAANPS